MAHVNEFDAFVKRQRQTESPPVEAKAIRDAWLNQLGILHGLIENYLADYKTRGEIQIQYEDVLLNEESLGSYFAPQMILRIGSQEIILQPIGAEVIGVKGRVDIIGSAGKVRLVLVDRGAHRVILAPTDDGSIDETPKANEWAWKIATAPPRIEFLELTPDSFYRSILEVVNG